MASFLKHLLCALWWLQKHEFLNPLQPYPTSLDPRELLANEVDPLRRGDERDEDDLVLYSTP